MKKSIKNNSILLSKIDMNGLSGGNTCDQEKYTDTVQRGAERYDVMFPSIMDVMTTFKSEDTIPQTNLVIK